MAHHALPAALMRSMDAVVNFARGIWNLPPASFWCGVRLMIALVVSLALAGVGWRLMREARARLEAAAAVDASLRRLVTASIVVATFAAVAIAWLLLLARVDAGAGMAAAGVVLALAVLAKACLGNVIAGISLAVGTDAASGHMVRIEGREMQLRQLGITHATFKGSEGETLLLPNTMVAASTIDQSAGLGVHQWIDVSFRLGLHTSPEQILALLADAAASISGALRVPAPIIRLGGIDGAAFEFVVRVAVSADTVRAAAQSDLRLALVRAARARGLDLPHAQTDVHLRDLDLVKAAFTQAMEERRRARTESSD